MLSVHTLVGIVPHPSRRFKMATADKFVWPWQYSFPPFFTIQPNTDTRTKQIEDWCDLLLNYFKFHLLHKLDVMDAQTIPLFQNHAINRKLSLNGIKRVLDHLEGKGCLEWEDAKARNRCYIFWRHPEEWADIVFQWVKRNGLDDTVCTLYEIIANDAIQDAQLVGLDTYVLKKAIQVLERRGKAKLFIDDGTGEEDGVKFFS